MPTAYNVSAAAAIVGASPSTIRNWIKTFAPYLSPGASPQAGAERILTPADVATLQYIKTQRDALKDYDMIVAELTAMPPGAALQPYIDVQATATQPEAPQSPAVGIGSADVLLALQSLADERYSLLQKQIDATNAVQGDRLTWFAYGLLAGLLLALVGIGVVWLGWAAR